MDYQNPHTLTSSTSEAACKGQIAVDRLAGRQSTVPRHHKPVTRYFSLESFRQARMTASRSPGAKTPTPDYTQKQAMQERLPEPATTGHSLSMPDNATPALAAKQRQYHKRDRGVDGMRSLSREALHQRILLVRSGMRTPDTPTVACA
jgi:hypothetical protein